MLVILIAAALMAGPVQSPAAGDPQAPAPAIVKPGDVIEAIGNEGSTIRGRVDRIATDAIVLQTRHGEERVPFQTLQRIDRIGDSLFNGTAVGAAIGGASTIALIAKICSNSNCADTPANLDPRLTLLGTVIGAGVGALIDRAFVGRKTTYRAGAGQLLVPGDPGARGATGPGQGRAMVVGRFGWARLTDDEGSLGSGPTIGTGIVLPIRRRLGVQIEYDRHTRAREFEAGRGFFGTEQLVTAKALFYFGSNDAIRPYAGVGLGMIDSRRRSEFPTFTAHPGDQPAVGLPEILGYHTRGAVLGFAAGADARVTSHLSILGDLSLDVGSAESLGSTRLTLGAGWRF
jgi:hypothetical protein